MNVTHWYQILQNYAMLLFVAAFLGISFRHLYFKITKKERKNPAKELEAIGTFGITVFGLTILIMGLAVISDLVK
jgi:hypothetical protein